MFDLKPVHENLRMYFRKIYILVIIFSLLNICGVSSAASKKYTGTFITSCRIYQLGEDEFILKLYGKNLPAPETESEGNSINITLKNVRVRNPKKLNASVYDTLYSVPLVYGFNITNLKGDIVSIKIDVNFPLQSASGIHSSDGYTLRLKTTQQQTFTHVPETPDKQVQGPENTLPFMIDTRISVELRDAELRDVLRMLMSYVGRNIIIDSTFPNNALITMTLTDVRIDEVLNHLMRTYDIACYSMGANTIVFGPREGLYKLSGEKQIRSFRISYAELGAVRTMLASLAGIQGSEITADERLRTLYINTNPAKMEEAADIISRIDVPSQQVLIRASIFEFNDSASDAVASALQVAYDEWLIEAGGDDGIRLDYYEDRSIRQTRNPRTARTMSAVFSALESEGKGRVIANPSVIAIDGQSATIELTHTYTYSVVRDDAGNSIASEQDVGPTLTFTPRIERDGYIHLDLNLSTGDVVGDFRGTPITSDRSVTTNVRVRDGMPFVVGGLFQNNKNTSVTKIPIIGDLPLIGNLFRSKSVNNTRTQAVMVVTPYILDSN